MNQPQSVSQNAYGMTNYVDRGGLSFDVQTEFGPRRGGVFAKTVLTPYTAIEGGGWEIALLLGYLSPPEAEKTAVATVGKMAEGFRWDPQWEARQEQSLIQVHGAVMQAQRQTSAIINQTYANRSPGPDDGGEVRGPLRQQLLFPGRRGQHLHRNRHGCAPRHAQPLVEGDADRGLTGRGPAALRIAGLAARQIGF